MKLGTQVCLGPGHIVLDRDPAPPKGHSPQLSAHICCSQMAAWIKMPLGMDVCLGPGDFVVDGDPAPPSPRRGRSPPNFRYMFIVANGWMDQDGTWHGCRPQPRRLCVRWGLGTQLPLPKKEAEPPPQFSALVYCGQTLDGSRWHSAWRRALVQATLC